MEPYYPDRVYIEIPAGSGWTPASFLEHMMQLCEPRVDEGWLEQYPAEKKIIPVIDENLCFDVPDMPMPGFSQRKI